MVRGSILRSSSPLFAICVQLDEPIPVFDSGENHREWIHVEDHCLALMALFGAEGVVGGVFNIGTGERRTTQEFAGAVVDVMRKPRDLISQVEDRPGRVLCHAVDSEKLMSVTGWSPDHRFDTSLPGVLEWYVGNVDSWRYTVLGVVREYFAARYPSLEAAVERM